MTYIKGIILPYKASNDNYVATIYSWAEALELRDIETQGHAQRVSQMMVLMAQRLNLPEVKRIRMTH